jgi:hypothetical protein
MTDPDRSRHVEVESDGQPVAAAEVTTSAEAGGTARASLHASAGHIAPGSRASLVDAVMDLPEVQASARLKATIPLGDGEMLERLRERTEDVVTRPAGSTALLEANIPAGSQSGPDQDIDGGTGAGVKPADERGSAQRRKASVFEIASIREWRGHNVVDAEGHKIGELEAVYVDTSTDQPSFGTVQVGLPTRHRLVFVPLNRATVGPGYLKVAYDRKLVKDAPSIDMDGELPAGDEEAIFQHYGLAYQQGANGERLLARR